MVILVIIRAAILRSSATPPKKLIRFPLMPRLLKYPCTNLAGGPHESVCCAFIDTDDATIRTDSW